MTGLLTCGADIIQRDGLVQDEYYDASVYVPGKPCRVCPRAAIAIAAGQHPLFAVNWPMRCTADDPTAEEVAVYEAITEAERRLAAYIRTELGYEHGSDDQTLIERWVDDGIGQQPQVIGAMRAADQDKGVPHDR